MYVKKKNSVRQYTHEKGKQKGQNISTLKDEKVRVQIGEQDVVWLHEVVEGETQCGGAEEGQGQKEDYVTRRSD